MVVKPSVIITLDILLHNVSLPIGAKKKKLISFAQKTSGSHVLGIISMLVHETKKNLILFKFAKTSNKIGQKS